MRMREAQLVSLCSTWILYGKGLAAWVVIGGMWSLWALAKVTIFMAVVRRVCSMARRTLARSVPSQRWDSCNHWVLFSEYSKAE